MRRAVVAAHLLVLAFGIWGCTGETTRPPVQNGDTEPEVTGDAGKLRVVYLVHGSAGVDLQLDGEAAPWFQRLAHGSATPWAEVRPDEPLNIEVRESGSDPASSPLFSSERLSIAPGERVTVLITGTGAAADPLRSMVVRHPADPPAEGKARVLFLNGSSSGRALDLDVANDGSKELQRVAPFVVQSDAAVEVETGSELAVGLFGGDDAEPGGSFALPPLASGQELLLVSTGPFERMELFPIDESGVSTPIEKNPVVYVLNASPDSPEVNLFNGARRLAAGLKFGQMERFEIIRGRHPIDVFASAAGPTRPAGSPAMVAEINFRPGEKYLVVMGGFFTPKPKGKAGQEAERHLELFEFRTGFAAAGAPLLRVVHAIPDAPERVDFGTVPGPMAFDVIEDLKLIPYGKGSALEGFQSALTTTRLGVAPSNTAGVIGTFDLTPQAEQRLFGVTAGAVSPDVDEQGFSMLLVDATKEPWQVTRMAPAQ